ncbi:MAG: glycosyltransferase family 4 protein [Caldilineaceae bacterium]|nr:glycosyltransferase family 4 protein [Caldilineaceae bacterium]
MGNQVCNRVLMLLENAPYLLDSRVRPEATALVAAGYQVAVISPGLINQPLHELVEGVHLYRYPVVFMAGGAVGYFFEYGYALAATFVLSWYVLMRRGFDVIHAHNPPDLFVLIAAFYKLFGKRFIFDQHDLAPEMFEALFKGKHARIHQLLVWFERLSCRLADRVIVTNQSYQRMDMRRSGIPQERITIVRNGPRPNRLRLVEPDPELVRKGKTILIYIGVMGHHDGIDYLLRALHHLAYSLKRHDFYCVLIGQGAAWSSLKKLASELCLDEYVRFTGWIPDDELVRILSTADIGVDPDPATPFTDMSTMTKMMEYMALGKPIVAFDLTEHRFTAESAAEYARPNDVCDFAQKIVLLMDDPQRRQTMGEFGRRRVEMELAWPHQVKHLLCAYEAVGLRAAQ